MLANPRFYGALLLVLGVFAGACKPGYGQIAAKPTLTIHSQGQTSGTLQRISMTASGSSLGWIGQKGSAPCLFQNPRSVTPNQVSETVQAFVQSIRTDLGIPMGIDFGAAKSHSVAKVWQTTIPGSINGIPVRERQIEVITGAESGSVMFLTSDLPQVEPRISGPTLSEKQVLSQLPQIFGDENAFRVDGASSLVYVVKGNQFLLAYEVWVRQSNPAHLWRMTIDATNGATIEKREMLEFIDRPNSPAPMNAGRLTAHVRSASKSDSMIVVGLPNTKLTVDGKLLLTDSAGNWSTGTTTSSSKVSAVLQSDFSRLIRLDTSNGSIHDLTVTGNNATISWDSTNSVAAERDAFYYSDLAHIYVKKLDPSIAHLDDSLTVNVNFNAACNAFYDPRSVSLNFFHAGNNCTNTGEIPDVIMHEFGHRVIHSRYIVSKNGYIVNSSLNEGFADLVSAFIRDDPRIGIGFFQNDKNKVLRNCDNTKNFPWDVNYYDSHVTGEIISGAIWDLRETIGHDAAEKLFHNMMWLAPDGTEDAASYDVLLGAFVHTLIDLLLVDDDNNNILDGTPHSAAILSAFQKHNINLAQLISLNPAHLGDQDTNALFYSVPFSVGYSGPIGKLDTNSLMLSYSTDNGKTYTSVTPKRTGDSTYVGAIPKVNAGTIVQYYVSAGTTIPNGGTITSPPQFIPYFFTVGYQRYYFDDCEKDNGWSLGLPTDKAVSGRWVRAKPNGTFIDSGVYIQQDTDHTPNGTMCYVTGNMATTNFSADDVDSGATTLTTNTLDLSQSRNPVISYWYYYSNDQGYNAGKPIWWTQISNDSGATWKNVQFTSSSTSGWTPYLIRVSDYFAATSRVQLRFIASDFVGAIVEAGVDDLEVLTAPPASQPASAVTSFVSGGLSVGSIVPNPSLASHGVRLTYTTPVRGHILIVVKDINGDNVAVPLDEMQSAGTYSINLFGAKHLAPGVYWVVLSTEHDRVIRKLVIE